jgi:hypothetical protein
MGEILEANDSFDFEKLVLTKPVAIPGGNFFITFSMDNLPLYIQPPKCKTKQGIISGGKRPYSDLMFTSDNDQFIRWMENLENHCQQSIYKNREKWFDGDLELRDIENYLTSPLKLYKSGKFYIIRTNVTPSLGRIQLKIYDENENEVALDAITDETNIMTILEFQGIKCSARSFQIEIELKQMMVLNPTNLFEKCIIKSKKEVKDNTIQEDVVSVVTEPTILAIQEVEVEKEKEKGPTHYEMEEQVTEEQVIDKDDSTNIVDTIVNDVEPVTNENDMQEIEFHLDELPDTDTIQIKKRDDVYYEIYREAKQKAKDARDLALSTYLEAKRFKNTYMLEDITDSDDSDLENDSDENNE